MQVRIQGEFVFKNLWPQDTSFFNNFEAQADLLIQAARVFLDMASEGIYFEERICQIKKLEQEADKLVHRSIETLHKTFITPFDREDIHALTTLLDDIVDEIEAVADCIGIYKIKQLTPFTKDCAQILAACSLEISHLVRHLREPTNIKSILKHCENICQAKHNANQIRRNALGQLFDEELDARTIIKWKEIYEHLEKAIDLCDDVANVIEGIILEYS
jgi:predicted phosphate transport protein (TIGR00153 family)